MTILSPVSYKSTGTILYMLNNNYIKILRIPSPKRVKTKAVLIAYWLILQNPKSKYKVVPKPKIQIINCKYYFFTL
jgi:hypothetical protein